MGHLFAQAALDAMCSYLPKSISAQCTTFVDTYTEMIIDMLTKVRGLHHQEKKAGSSFSGCDSRDDLL